MSDTLKRAEETLDQAQKTLNAEKPAELDPKYALAIYSADRQLLVGLDAENKTMVFGETYEPDHAAQLFWDAILSRHAQINLSKARQDLTSVFADVTLDPSSLVSTLVEVAVSLGAQRDQITHLGEQLKERLRAYGIPTTHSL